MTNGTAYAANTAFEHVSKAGQLQYTRAARSCRTVAATAQLLTSGRMDASAVKELAELQEAVWQRAWSLGDSWLAAWNAWWNYAGQTKGVNTASKLAERQTNSIAQIAQLFGGQLTDLVAFQENVEVNYAYWVSEKLAE